MKASEALSNLRENVLPLSMAMQSPAPDKRCREGTGLGLGMLLDMATRHCMGNFGNKGSVRFTPFMVLCDMIWSLPSSVQAGTKTNLHENFTERFAFYQSGAHQFKRMLSLDSLVFFA
jgi:hypothetical protein